MDDLVGQLNDNEKSGALLYAVYDKKDNAAVIEQLLAHGTVPTKEANTTFVDMLRTDTFDQGNLEALMKGSDAGTENMRQIASALGKA